MKRRLSAFRPLFAALDECAQSTGKYQDDRRGGKGSLRGQTSAPACFSGGLYFSCCMKGAGEFKPSLTERTGTVCSWCSVLVRAPVLEETKIKLVAARRLHTCGVEVLPSLGLNANSAAASCLGPGGEEIQPAWGSNLSDILPASASKTHPLPSSADPAPWPGRLLSAPFG